MTDTIPSAHCEAKLHGFRRTNDGVVVSFVLHPQEVPQALALDPLGTRYMLALAQIGDDEQPISPQPERVDPGTASNTDSSPKHRRPFHTLPLSQQAALLCDDAAFQQWASGTGIGPTLNKEQAAQFIRNWCCNGESRSTLDTNPEYAKRFLAMLERFEIAVGRRVEPR